MYMVFDLSISLAKSKEVWCICELFVCLKVDFRDYPPLLRQAVSIARKIQDPLVEYAQVCGTDEDILCLKLHPLQVRDKPKTWHHFVLPQ